MARDLTQVMWEKFIIGLSSTSAGKGLDPKTVMPTSGLTLANWEVMDTTGLPPSGLNPPAKGSTIVPALEEWANVMPDWSPNYTPSSRNFYDQYCAFLNSIALKGGNPALQQIADGYATNLSAATKALSADKTAAMKGWTDFNSAQAGIPPAAQTSYSQYYQDNWAATILADSNKVSAQLQLFNTAMSNVGGPDYITISNAQKKVLLTAGGSGLSYPDATSGLLYPLYTASPRLNDWYINNLNAMALNAPNVIDFTIDLTDDNTGSTAESSYLDTSASASYSAFFWGGSASASYGQSQGAQSYDSLVQGLKMRYTAKAATLFSFSPGPWYDSAMISGFADQISATSALANKKMTGEGGFLNIRTAQVLVVLNPSVTLTGDSTTIAAVSHEFKQQSSASISIGGFCWSACAGVSQGQGSYDNDVKVSTDGLSITMTDSTNAPKVILIIPSKPT